MPTDSDLDTPTIKTSAGVQALETGLAVLEVFGDLTRPAMLKDIASAANMHPAKVHRYLVSFIKKGYVEQDAHGRYSLGRSALRMGLAGLAQSDAVRLVSPVLDDLNGLIGETVLAAVWGNRGPTVVQWRDAPHAVTVNVRPGSVMPLLSSATGRVFAAFLDPRLTQPYIDVEQAAANATHEQVQGLIARIRNDGIGQVTGDLVAGINSVSAPVFNHDGKLVLAITALGNDAVFDASPDGRAADMVRAAAAGLSSRLGYGVIDSR